MDISDSFSSQEGLPLSQESFKDLWQKWNEQDNYILNTLDTAAELKKYLINDSNLCKVEDSDSNQLERSDNVVTPASTSSDIRTYTIINKDHSDNVVVPTSTSSDVRMYTNLNKEHSDNVVVPASTSSDVRMYTNLSEEHSDNVVVPASTSSDVRMYTNLNIPAPAITQQINSNNIPPSTNWPGDYDFQISFQPQEKATKNTPWTYSEIIEKLYVNMAVACPVNVHVMTKPPSGSVIRAMVIFSRSEYITEVVKRCIIHSSLTDALNNGHPAPEHLVRCDNSASQYIEDRITKRQSVVAPYEDPQVGMKYTTYLYRFMCLGSCVGGPNRRPLKLIFTLEKDGGCCLGRKVMDLRICACPGRDQKIDEKQFEKSQLKKSSSHSKTNLDMFGPPLKKQKSDSGIDESRYTLIVHQIIQIHYELLKKVKDALKLANLLSPEESARLPQKQVRPKKNRRENQQSSEDSSN